MRKPASVFLSIDKPCSQNWDEMVQERKGRFCTHCRKTVVDFSHLSDTELYQYLQNNKDSCGRFNPHQLNTPIRPAREYAGYWRRLYKPVAALLAFLSMKYNSAATGKKEWPTTISPFDKKTTVNSDGDKIIISGNVTNDFKEPLENAEIRMNDVVVARTDKQGHYEFEFKPDPKAKAYTLSASYPGLSKMVRSYHPAMLSTTYDFRLYDPKESGYTMGVYQSSYDQLDTAAFCFKKNISTLNNDMLPALSSIANQMRNRPELTFNIVAYTRNSPEQPIGKKRQELIKKFLVDMEGISEERFLFVTEPKSEAKKHTVEIIVQKRE